MKKLLATALLLSSCTTAFAQSAPAASPAASWLVEAGVFYRMGKLCPGRIAPADQKVLGDLLLGASVDPHMRTIGASEQDISTMLHSPTLEQMSAAKVEKAVYEQVVTLVTLKHEMEKPECPADLTQRVNALADKARSTGAAAHAKRIVAVMLREQCVALGMCMK